mmetsp:Transcript_23809/g.53713  ORF Transcript_23809/g.53713 Transcript_23809/m.53713 type:complete len:225 (+) Transcript_23809:241-915(+)|eukprot:CAMPEP_0172588998 /NCGR_PEP_ID=MMETSP1068-20121228/7806_1 /TAXON_ID=35684 /ORGANISM="Pseudopedinella elastica, Strain CCMP716" /LENGTH=224 /DNA_ID=CAMNT_0013384487 /DNA_START=212 /DNA_END=886 /DNA_ORIENTATION=+
MVKHNNVIPNQHFHKKWAGGANGSMRGPIHIVTWFHQAAQKKARRLKRAEKAAKVSPRPTGGLLRPAVHCPTIKYNSKVRLGRGFTAEELKAAKIPLKLARTIGIAVDLRRVNKSAESLARNVARLSEYKEKLVLFPKKKLSAPKKGEASPAEQAAATQYMGAPLPLAKAAPDVASMKVTAELKATMCHSQIRVARTDAKLVGLRAKAKKEKEEAEKEKKNKKK